MGKQLAALIRHIIKQFQRELKGELGPEEQEELFSQYHHIMDNEDLIEELSRSGKLQEDFKKIEEYEQRKQAMLNKVYKRIFESDKSTKSDKLDKWGKSIRSDRPDNSDESIKSD